MDDNTQKKIHKISKALQESQLMPLFHNKTISPEVLSDMSEFVFKFFNERTHPPELKVKVSKDKLDKDKVIVDVVMTMPTEFNVDTPIDGQLSFDFGTEPDFDGED